MATKKICRTDGTYMISTDTTENPKLGAKVLNNGKESLFFDYYYGYQKIFDDKKGKEVVKINRKRKYLSLYLWQSPKTPQEKQENKETLEIAKKIRFERQQELLEASKGYRIERQDDINFLNSIKIFFAGYKGKRKNSMKCALKRFTDFLSDTPEYNNYIRAKRLKPEQVTKDMIISYTEYLQNRSKGGAGALTYYKQFKVFINYALEHNILKKNPCKGVNIKADTQQLRKDILSQEEIQVLISTKYEGNPIIKKAFIFCLYTGLRYCDVAKLTFANIDFKNRQLNFEQEKTKGHSAKSSVSIPLNEGILNIIDTPKSKEDREKLIFALPCYKTCVRTLQRWIDSAGIYKHITWHCARHSFAVNILNNGANIKTVASLLGHSGLSQTEKYTRVVDSLKQDAINSLPKFNL